MIERNTSELETEGIQDRVQMQQATVLDISNRSLESNLFGYGHGNFRVIRNDIKQTSEFDEGLRPTGPHNSFLFLILDYGFVGLLLFLTICLNPLLEFLKNIKYNLLKPEYLFLGCFVGLSITGDFIQNHSISVLFFLVLFKLQLITKHAK